MVHNQSKSIVDDDIPEACRRVEQRQAENRERFWKVVEEIGERNAGNDPVINTPSLGDNPDLIFSNPVLGWKVANWYWMTTSSGCASPIAWSPRMPAEYFFWPTSTAALRWASTSDRCWSAVSGASVPGRRTRGR